MSFLSGGAECSTGRNPLAQFTKHVSEDKSLQRDRMVGGRPAGGMQGIRSQVGPMGPTTGDQQVSRNGKLKAKRNICVFETDKDARWKNL